MVFDKYIDNSPTDEEFAALPHIIENMNKEPRGSFSCESGVGSVFYWFHSSNPIASYQSGIPSGGRNYNGAEQLVLVYNSALATNYQIDVYAGATSVYNQTLSGVSRS